MRKELVYLPSTRCKVDVSMFNKNFMKGCVTCQQMKINTHPMTPLLSPIKSDATHPFALVTTDFITNLLESDGFDALMVVVDHGLTKGAILFPCNKTIDTIGAATLHLDHVYKRFGLPDKLISDRDPRFASQLFQELGQILRIKLAMSTAYHPQTDRETERVNQEIEVYLRMFFPTTQRIGYTSYQQQNSRIIKEHTQYRRILPFTS
jgi:hypothetical protein